MPTGYTADIASGKDMSFRKFVLHAARGMGALVTMRDEPWDAPIPERFEPNTKHHDKELIKLRAERDRIYSLTDEECDVEAHNKFQKEESQRTENRRKAEEIRTRYQEMIRKTRDWQNSPEGLKSFMLEQLSRGMEFDCNRREWPPFVPVMGGQEWKNETLKKICEDIEYHGSEIAKEKARTESRNAWLAQLHRALEGVEA